MPPCAVRGYCVMRRFDAATALYRSRASVTIERVVASGKSTMSRLSRFSLIMFLLSFCGCDGITEGLNLNFVTIPGGVIGIKNIAGKGKVL